MKFTPRQYQIEGKDFLKARRHAMLGDAPGVGKTGQAILAMDELVMEGDIKDRVLIVTPASVKRQWQQALADWASWESAVIHTSKDTLPGNRQILIVNYDLLYREPLLSVLLKLRFDLIIYDEAHKLKSPSAKRTKVALGKKYLRPRTKRIWFLTGTPVKNRTVDLFPILRTCASECIKPYDKYYSFAYRYCGAYKGAFGLDTSGASHTEELRERLKPFLLRREKRDVLTELPERVVTTVPLECTPAAKKVIEEEEMRTVEAAGEDDPSMFRLGEIARIRKALAKYKVPGAVSYIKDLLEEEEKLVVFFYHKEVLRELRESFKGVPNVFIDGSVPPAKRTGIVESFTGGEGIRLFFGQMEACGEAIDGLQHRASTCVFVEPSWSHTDIEQCIGRLERDGQRNDINVHLLVIESTLEERMMDVVAQKLEVDKVLYNQQDKKEKKMATKKEVELEERKVAALERIADALANPLREVAIPDGHAGDSEDAVAVTPAQEDVTEDALRARAADIAQLQPDGTGKKKAVAVIQEIGGGKLADLATPKLRAKCMAAFDKLYAELENESVDDV